MRIKRNALKSSTRQKISRAAKKIFKNEINEINILKQTKSKNQKDINLIKESNFGFISNQPDDSETKYNYYNCSDFDENDFPNITSDYMDSGFEGDSYNYNNLFKNDISISDNNSVYSEFLARFSESDIDNESVLSDL